MLRNGAAEIGTIVSIVTIGSGENAAEMHSDLLHECDRVVVADGGGISGFR